MIIIVIVLIIDDGHGDDDNEVGTDRNWLKARVYFLQTNSCLLPAVRLMVLRVSDLDCWMKDCISFLISA